MKESFIIQSKDNMKNSSKHYNLGFMMVIPLLLISLTLATLTVQNISKIHLYGRSIEANKEKINNDFERESCLELGLLYKTMDPDYFISC